MSRRHLRNTLSWQGWWFLLVYLQLIRLLSPLLLLWTTVFSYVPTTNKGTIPTDMTKRKQIGVFACLFPLLRSSNIHIENAGYAVFVNPPPLGPFLVDPSDGDLAPSLLPIHCHARQPSLVCLYASFCSSFLLSLTAACSNINCRCFRSRTNSCSVCVLWSTALVTANQSVTRNKQRWNHMIKE